MAIVISSKLARRARMQHGVNVEPSGAKPERRHKIEGRIARVGHSKLCLGLYRVADVVIGMLHLF
jgi:hypothetical protein